MNARAQDAQQAQDAKAQQQADIQSMQQQLEMIQTQQTQAVVAPPAAVAPTTAGTDLITQLQQLGDLKSAGLLTDAEFEVAKARVLSS
jgi:hypothetical protein